MDEAKKENINYEYKQFSEMIMPYGSSDLWTALELLEEIKAGYLNKFSTASILWDIIDECKNSTGQDDISQFDVVALVYEDILQQARNKIDEVAKYDFQNDFKGVGTSIYVAGNYCATTLDFSEDAKNELAEKIKPFREELEKDVFVNFLIEDLGI